MTNPAAVCEVSTMVHGGPMTDSPELDQRIRELTQVLWQRPGLWNGAEHPILAHTLVKLAHDYKRERYLEIGFMTGSALLPMAMYGIDVTGIDNGEEWRGFTDEDYVEGVCRWADEYGFERPNLLIGPAEALVDGLDVVFDMVFIDHAKELYVDCLRSLVEGGKLAPGAMVLFHDTDHHIGSDSNHWTPWEDIVEFVVENDLGDCYALSDGYNGLRCHNLGLLVLKEDVKHVV